MSTPGLVLFTVIAGVLAGAWTLHDGRDPARALFALLTAMITYAFIVFVFLILASPAALS